MSRRKELFLFWTLLRRSFAKGGKFLVKSLLFLYRTLISPLLGQTCRFYPSCSVYALAAVEKYGAYKGSYLTAMRLAKCHPFHPGGFDPVR